MSAEDLFALSDAMAPGEFCDERCDHGGAGTLEPDHPGDHEAHGFGGVIHCTWPNDTHAIIEGELA